MHAQMRFQTDFVNTKCEILAYTAQTRRHKSKQVKGHSHTTYDIHPMPYIHFFFTYIIHLQIQTDICPDIHTFTCSNIRTLNIHTFIQTKIHAYIVTYVRDQTLILSHVLTAYIHPLHTYVSGIRLHYIHTYCHSDILI